MNRREFVMGVGTTLLASSILPQAAAAKSTTGQAKQIPLGRPPHTALNAQGTVAADPTNVPPPITRGYPIHHEIELEACQVTAKLDSGATFDFMTWNGQVPGPILRVREGDTVSPGSCFVGDMNLPLAQTIKLVDHSLSRVVRQGLLAEIEVMGKGDHEVFSA